MRNWLFCVFALMLLNSSLLAQDKHDGNALSEECTAALHKSEHPDAMDGFNTGVCFGMVDGIRETLVLWNKADSQHKEAMFHGCISDAVTVEEAVKVVLKYLNDNPTQLHYRDAFLVSLALSKGYPCAASSGATK